MRDKTKSRRRHNTWGWSEWLNKKDKAAELKDWWSTAIGNYRILRIEVSLIMSSFSKDHRLRDSNENTQQHPTEPANYTDCYLTVRKEIADIEITLYRNPGTVIIDIITFAPRTIIITTAMQMPLVMLKVSEEQEEGLGN
jgi:hypothetical protein